MQTSIAAENFPIQKRATRTNGRRSMPTFIRPLSLIVEQGCQNGPEAVKVAVVLRGAAEP